jgi:hypothetical protein
MLSLLASGWRRSVTGRLLRNVSHFVNHRVVVSQRMFEKVILGFR